MSVSEDDLVRRINETRAALGLPPWLLPSEQVTRDEVAAMVRDECSKVQVEHGKAMEHVSRRLRDLERMVWPPDEPPLPLSERIDRLLDVPIVSACAGPVIALAATAIAVGMAWIVMHLRWVN